MVKDKDMYIFKKLNRLCLAGTFARDKSKKFYFYQELRINKAPDLTYEVVPTLKVFFIYNNDKFFNVLDNFIGSLDYKTLSS